MLDPQKSIQPLIEINAFNVTKFMGVSVSPGVVFQPPPALLFRPAFHFAPHRSSANETTMTKKPDPSDPKQESTPEVSSRRMAIKRIATIVSGIAAGTVIFGRVQQAWGQYSSRYTSIGTIYGSSYNTSTYRTRSTAAISRATAAATCPITPAIAAITARFRLLTAPATVLRGDARAIRSE